MVPLPCSAALPLSRRVMIPPGTLLYTREGMEFSDTVGSLLQVRDACLGCTVCKRCVGAV